MRDRIRKGWSSGEDGMSLVEVMIAIFVLAVALLALASTAITSVVSLRVSRTRQEATDAASAMIENLRRADFTTIALDGADPDVVADLLSSPLAGCDPEYDEPYVTTDLPDAVPYTQAFGPSGRVTVTTTISHFDEGDDEDCTHGDRRAKRVRVVAAWQDKGETFTVEESTVVAPVDRGLPAPDFRVGTPDVALAFTPAELGTEKCIGHVVRNLGATDGYDWTIRRTDSGTVIKPTTSEFTTASGKVRVRAFFENPAAEPPIDPADHGIPSGIQRYSGVPAGLEMLIDEDGNGRPETDPDEAEKLASGEQARLWICYLLDPSLTVGTTMALEGTVHSQFDGNRQETVEHLVRVTKQPRTFHLFDDDTSATGASGPRVVTSPQGNKLILPVQFMGPEVAIQPQKLGTGSLPNFDTDFDPLPGLRLKDGPRASVSEDPWPSSTVAFHEQITPGVTFEPTFRLWWWSASTEALTEGDSDDVDARRLDYRVRLQVLTKNENQVVATLLDEPINYTHTNLGFRGLYLERTLSGAIVVGNEQFLRLEITCLPSSEDTCHIAYDNTTFPSRLQLVEQ